MDYLHLSEEIKELKRLREFYEEQLKLVGIDMCDFGDDIVHLLDEAVEFQRISNLQDLRESHLKSFYYKKKMEHLNYEAIGAELRNEINKQKRELEKEQEECNILEKFILSTNKHLISEAQKKSSKLEIESSIKNLKDHMDALEMPDDFNVDELIRKVDLLKPKYCKEKK